MVLAQNIIKEGGKYKITEKEGIIENYPEGLHKIQVDFIKKSGLKKINIQKVMPFAPFMFLGVIITLILGENLLTGVLRWIMN